MKRDEERRGSCSTQTFNNCLYRISTSTYLLITTCRPVRAVNVQRQYSYWRFKYSNVQFVTVTTTHLCISRGRQVLPLPMPGGAHAEGLLISQTGQLMEWSTHVFCLCQHLLAFVCILKHSKQMMNMKTQICRPIQKPKTTKPSKC